MIEQAFDADDRTAFNGQKYCDRTGIDIDTIYMKGNTFMRPDGSAAADPQGVDASDQKPTRPDAAIAAVQADTATTDEVRLALKYYFDTTGM